MNYSRSIAPIKFRSRREVWTSSWIWVHTCFFSVDIYISYLSYKSPSVSFFQHPLLDVLWTSHFMSTRWGQVRSGQVRLLRRRLRSLRSGMGCIDIPLNTKCVVVSFPNREWDQWIAQLLLSNNDCCWPQRLALGPCFVSFSALAFPLYICSLLTYVQREGCHTVCTYVSPKVSSSKHPVIWCMGQGTDPLQWGEGQSRTFFLYYDLLSSDSKSSKPEWDPTHQSMWPGSATPHVTLSRCFKAVSVFCFSSMLLIVP
jgi:hypothetical protein